MLSEINSFLRRQTGNFRVMLVLKPSTMLFEKLTEPYQWIYTRILGADALQLGYVGSLGGFASAVISAPMGWLADKYDLKRVMIITLILHLSVPLFYGMAWDWQMVIPAVALSTTSIHLMWSTSNIFIAESTTDVERGSGFALIQSLSQISAVLSPLAAGYIIAALGGISVQSIRPLFYAHVIGLAILCCYAYRRIENPPQFRVVQAKRGFFSDFEEIFKNGVGLKRFILVRCLSAFTNSLVTPFTMVFAREIKGADALGIGVMVTVLTVVAMLVAIPLGRFSDRYGRRRLIFLQELGTCAQYFLLVVAPAYRPEYLVLAWAVGGIPVGGMGWSTMIMEMVPPDQRGRWGGISELFTGIARVPASIIGGLLWTRFNPALPFVVFIIADLLITMPLLATIPETLKHQN